MLRLSRSVPIQEGKTPPLIDARLHVPLKAAKTVEVIIVAPLPNRQLASNGMARFIHYIANEIVALSTSVRVFTQIGAGFEKSARYEQVEVWEPGIRSFYNIYCALIKNKAKFVSLHHEIFLYGPLRCNALLLVFLALARLSKIKVITTMHHALDVKSIALALAGGEHIPKPFIPLFQIAANIFNYSVAALSHRVTVHKVESILAFPSVIRHRVTVIPLIIERETVEDVRCIDVVAKYGLPNRFALAFA